MATTMGDLVGIKLICLFGFVEQSVGMVSCRHTSATVCIAIQHDDTDNSKAYIGTFQLRFY